MAGQGSARVTLKEIDLSQVSSQKLLPQGVPAAVVGPARKGPAFVPQTFANMQQFSETFGNMLERDREANSNLFGPMALNQWMQNSQAGTYLRVLGVGDGLKAENNVVTDAGFVVGTEQVQSTNKVAQNTHATINDNTETLRNAISAKSRRPSKNFNFSSIIALFFWYWSEFTSRLDFNFGDIFSFFIT